VPSILWRVFSCGSGGDVDTVQSHTLEPPQCGVRRGGAAAKNELEALKRQLVDSSPVPLPDSSHNQSTINQLATVNRRLSSVDRQSAYESSYVDASPVASTG
jgi:hypothetical protein